MIQAANSPNHTPEQAHALEEKALNLKIAGLSFRKIAEAMQVSHGTAHNYVKAALRRSLEITQIKADEYRAIELETLEAAQTALYPRWKEGDPDAIRTLIRIQERRARLLGLDAPEKLEHVGVVFGMPTINFATVNPDEVRNRIKDAIGSGPNMRDNSGTGTDSQV